VVSPNWNSRKLTQHAMRPRCPQRLITKSLIISIWQSVCSIDNEFYKSLNSGKMLVCGAGFNYE